MDRRDLSMDIVRQLKDINNDTGQFVAGILSDDISREDQITFALRLVRLAEHIKERAQSTAGMVIEGGIVDDGDSGLTRYLELLNRDSLLAPVAGVLAAQSIVPQARTLAEDRGIRCVVVDYDELRGIPSTELRLF
jgi:hypothetical protein